MRTEQETSYDVRDMSQLVRILGGNAIVAEWLDVTPSAVSNWIAEGFVARGHHLQVYLELERRGLRADPALFGMDQITRPRIPDKRPRRGQECAV